MRRAVMNQPALHRLAAVLAQLDPGAATAEGLPEDLPGILGLVEEAAGRMTGRVAQAEDAAQRLVAALGHVVQGVVVCDPSGGVVYRNAQAAVFVGARHGEALAERALTQLLAGALVGQAEEETIELFSPPRRTMIIRAAPLNQDGSVLGAVAIIEDITERRRLEAIRRDFVANISHELKTPVGALSLVAETLEEEDDPIVIARLSRRMRAEAERLSRIIEDLLDLSRIESEESPSRDPVPVHLIVAHAVERLRPVAEHRGIRLDLDEPPHHLVVLGDRRQLISAVYNLLDNAIKYSEDHSSVQLTVRQDGRSVAIAVADQGIGIPARDLERIFERFYRVDRARSRETGGTGLGLAIVRHVAGNHGGDVRVESREGEGSTFVLRLPSGAGAASLQPVGSKEANGG
jgi:two-component system, OmpR family, sensor histidine kinase SenX3